MKINFESLEPFYSNKNVTAAYDRANQLYVLRGEGIPTVDRIKDVMEAIIEFAKKNKVICGVADLTGTTGTFTGANSYVKERFVPAMMPLGYKYVGMVTSGNPFTRFAINALIGLVTPRGLKMKMFTSMAACEEWLSEQDEYSRK
jgi:hypothetical protein